MKTARLIAANTVAQMVGKVATIATTVFIGRLISSEAGLGLDGFNDYAIITAYAAYFYIVTDFGFNAIATQDISADESKSATYISNLFTLRIVLSIMLIMVGLAALSFLSEYSDVVKLGIITFLVTIVFQAIYTNGNVLFQARLRYIQSTIAVVSGSAVSLSLSYLVYRADGGLFGYLLAMILGSGVMAAVSLLQVNAITKVRLKFEWPIWRYLLLAALPLGLTIVFNLIYIRSGFFIISLVDNQNYGIYTMAYRVFDGALVLPVFIVNGLFPIMVKRLQESQEAFKKLFIKSAMGMVGLSLIIAAMVWATAPLAIAVSTDNPDAAPAVETLRWLSLLIPLFFMSNILLWATITLGKRKSLVAFYAIGAAISLGLNIWLIPEFGYRYAILITGVVEALVVLLMIIQLYLLLNGKSSHSGSGLTEQEISSNQAAGDVIDNEVVV